MAVLLCLIWLFPWNALLAPRKVGGEDAAMLGSPACGATVPSFIHISMASCTTFMPSIWGACRKPEPSTSWIVRDVDFAPPLCVAPSRSLLRPRRQVEHRCHRVSSMTPLQDRSSASFANHDHPPLDRGRFPRPVRELPSNFCSHPLKDPESGKTLVFITNNFSLQAATICALRTLKPLAGGTLLQVDQAASSDQAVLRHFGERGEDAVGLHVSVVCPRRHRQEAPRTWTPGARLHFVTDPLGDPRLSRIIPIHQCTCGR